MKNVLLYILSPLFLTGLFIFGLFQKKSLVPPDETSGSITICAPFSGSYIKPAADGKYVTALPGWGNYSYKITTKSDSAQFYFDQGLNMYYSYHMKEALASFKESSRIDPEAAMSYWGQALAMGPYYNAAHSYKMPAEIHEVLQKMNAKVSSSTASEKSLIHVMNFRYAADASDANRKTLNATYASAMRELILEYPDDQDIRALYVDAIMVIHAWDFWNNDGSPKPWTKEVVDLSEGILKIKPNHPAALHYHIHLTEASRNPEVALPNADKLRDLFPGVAHMVHMSSHEYQRNGLYGKGVDVNDQADKNLMHYDSLAKNLGLVKHSPHYFAVQTYCALSGAMFETGIRDAIRCRKSVAPTPETTYDQYLFMLPALTRVRLGKWSEILKDTVHPNEKWIYANLLDDFASGMAYVNTGKISLAKKHLARLKEKTKDPVLEKRRIPFNAPLPIALVAENILNASILFADKKFDQSVISLYNAIKIEDGLIYTEPNDWPIPARQFLGAFLMKRGKLADAEKVYREDLELNPGNGWSNLGLYQAVKAQGKSGGLAGFKEKYQQAFSRAEKIPAGSVFIN